MKVAILADIHANLVALERVLNEARSAGVEKLILLGDYVGYYYAPGAVIATLREWPSEAIVGNHDRMALAARRDPALLAEYRGKYGTGLDQAFDDLADEDWAWLESLPTQALIELGEWRIHLAHGAPFDDDAYIYPDASSERLAQTSQDLDVDAIWLGHTHWPFHSLGRPGLLNPGSVGQPRDIGGAASWAIFHIETGVTSFRRTEFPVEDLYAECALRDPDIVRNREVLVRRRLNVVKGMS